MSGILKVTCTIDHCTVKHHTDIINFACMTWNFVRISASLSALCTNIECRKEIFDSRSPFCTLGDQRFCQMWIDSFGDEKYYL